MTDDAPACMVMTTAPSDEVAAHLARLLVEAGAAACVQRLPIRSVYQWAGEVHDEPEVLLLAKTAEAMYAEVERLLLAHHPYETPEIVAVPISDGAPAYLAWLAAGGR